MRLTILAVTTRDDMYAALAGRLKKLESRYKQRTTASRSPAFWPFAGLLLAYCSAMRFSFSSKPGNLAWLPRSAGSCPGSAVRKSSTTSILAISTFK